MKKLFLSCLVLALCLSGCTVSISALDPEVSAPEQPVNSVNCAQNGFEMNLYSDKSVYKAMDIINIWATLQYVSDGDEITIWHGDPYMVFSITDGKDFNMDGMVEDILTSTVLEKDKLYHFDFHKSGGWSADDPNADFWDRFYQEKDLRLPVGEYTVTLRGAFSLSMDTWDNSGLVCELAIKVMG